MKSSTLQVVCWILLVFCNTVRAQTETKAAKKEPASSISGKVTIKGKGAPGIVVGVRSPEPYGPQTSTYKGTTDQDGNYKITNVPPGTYRVIPAAPAFVNSGGQDSKTLIIADRETVEGIDFALFRGGVITGKAVDSEGLPLIEEQITLLPAEANNQSGQYIGELDNAQTDDRGIYRIFGIPPGRYKVAAGPRDGYFGGGSRRSLYKQTFYPATTDPSKASIVDVTEGGEATDVDITVNRSLTTFTVSGRVVNGETLKPLPNVNLVVQRTISEGQTTLDSGPPSDIQGEFKLENLTPGKYAVFVTSRDDRQMRAEEVSFEVIDQDLTGLIVKTTEGGNGSVSGLIVLEGRNDKDALAVLSQARLQTFIPGGANGGPGIALRPVSINPDGSFRVGGLQSGLVHFQLTSTDHRPFTGLAIIRVERDGVAQPRGVEIRDKEQITGVRLVVRYSNGTVRGVVKTENGELPPTARISIRLSNLADDSMGVQRGFQPPPNVDSRGRFLAEGLAAGTYEVRATVFIPGSRIRPPFATQQVSVVEGGVTEVTITVNLAPSPGPGNP